MHHLLINGLEFVSAVIQGYCLQYFYGSFLENRFQKYWTKISVTVLYSLFQVGIANLLSEDYGTLRTIERLIVTLFILTVLAFVFYRAANVMTVFLIVAFSAVKEIVFFLSYMVLIAGSYLMDVWACFFNENPQNFIEIILVFSMILMHAVYAFLLCFSLRKIVGYFSEKKCAIQKTELAFLVTPGLMGLFICMFLRIIILAVNNGVPELLFDRHPILLCLVPVILLLSLLSILYGIKLFQDMIYLNRERSSRIILERQMEGLGKHVEEMERIHSEIRGMKHDMKNTLSIILRLAAENNGQENEQLEAYLWDLNKSMDRLDFGFKTGNGVVDILLDMKYHDMIKDIPDFKMDADCLLFPADMAIHSYDMGIIIGNALDNAMEACRKQKLKEPGADVFVQLSSFVKGRLFFVDIQNSFDGHLLQKEQAEFPVTDKKDSGVHGMGLINIKRAVEKYHGAVDWSVNNKIFTLSIMMKNERSNEDGG